MRKREWLEGFLTSNEVKKFIAAPWFFGIDNNQQSLEDFERKSLKILVAFLSPGKTRAVSNTYTALQAEILRVSDDVFVDYSYFPWKDDIEFFEKFGLPYWFGNISHAPVQDYDLVFVSTSILTELVNIFHAYKSCEIPYFYNDRVKDENSPLIIEGGIPVSDTDALGGESGAVDLVYLGFAEGRLGEIIEDCVKWKREGLDFKRKKKFLIKSLVSKYDNIYFPAGYDVKYNEEVKFKIDSITPKYDWVSDKLDFHKEYDLNKFSSCEEKIINPDNTGVDGVDFIISAGCTSGGSCSFCSEGYNCGRWREKSLDEIKKGMDRAIQYSAPNSFSGYSFNLGYYSRFLDLFYEVIGRFSGASLLNLRTDVISERPDYLKAADVLGLTTLSMPIEGFGERVRNLILNKTLSFDQIKKAFGYAMELKIMRIKIGFVLSGHETAEDFEEAANEFEELLRMRDEANANMLIQVNTTLLVNYPNTALGWSERKAALISSRQVRVMKPFFERFKGRIKFKFSSKEFSTAVEQLVLDLGRLGTSIWKEMAEEGFYYYSSNYSAAFFNSLKQKVERLGFKLEDIFVERPREWIFPMSMVVHKTEKYRDLLYESIGEKPLPPCLKTPVKRKPVCYNCGGCSTKEERVSIQNREFENEHTVEDLEVIKFENKPCASYRVGFSVDKSYELIGKESISHFIASRLLRKNELWKYFFQVKNISNYLTLQGNAEDWMYGKFFFDLLMKKDNLLEELRESLEEMKKNGVVKSSTLLSVERSPLGSRLTPSMKVVYVMELSGVSVDLLRESRIKYKGKLKYGMRGLFPLYGVVVEEKDENLPEIIIKSGKKGIYLGFVMEASKNPHLVLSSLLNIPYNKVLEKSSVQVCGYYGQPVGICRCGQQKFLDLIKMKEAKLCPSCLIKAYLKYADSIA